MSGLSVNTIRQNMKVYSFLDITSYLFIISITRNTQHK